jgi:sec-independent protein translocase protein TatA
LGKFGIKFNNYIMINTILLFLGGIGGWEVLLIMLVVLLLFGAKKIPELARGLGTGIREFKDASKDLRDEINKGMDGNNGNSNNRNANNINTNNNPQNNNTTPQA